MKLGDTTDWVHPTACAGNARLRMAHHLPSAERLEPAPGWLRMTITGDDGGEAHPRQQPDWS